MAESSGAAGVKSGGLFNRFFISLWLINLLSYIAHGSMNNLVSVYVNDCGWSSAYNGYIAVAFAVFAIAARFICGSLSDRIGRRILLVVSALLFGVGIFFFGLTGSLIVLLLMRGIQGFAFATNAQTVSAATADVMPPSKVGLGIGAIWIVQSISTILASRLTSSAIASGTFKTLFNVLSILMLACTVLSIFCNYEKKPGYTIAKAPEDGGEHGLRKYVEVKALPAAIMLIFVCGSFVGVTHFIFRYSDAIGYKTPDIFFLVSAVTMFVANILVARFADRVNPMLLLAPGIIGGVVCDVLIATATGNMAIIMPLAGAFHGISTGIAYPMFNQLAVKASPDSRRGAASATFYLAMDIGIAIGALLWGWAVDGVGFAATYYISAVCMVIAFIICWAFLGKRKNKTA